MFTRIRRLFAVTAIPLLAAGVASAKDVKDVIDYSPVYDSPAEVLGDYSPAGAVWQDTDAANKADAVRVATSRGVDVQAVLDSIEFQERLAKYLEELDDRHLDRVSRVWREPAPSTAAFIQFVGEVPDEVAPEGVRLLGGGVFTQAQHAHRAEVAADALKAAGFRNFLTHFDVPQDMIHVELVVPETAPEPDARRLDEVVQYALWTDAVWSGGPLKAAPARIDLKVTRRDGRVYDFDWSRGGLWCRDHDRAGDPEECTSGWAVSGPNGDGIITAAHCTGLDTIGGADHDLTFRSQERDMGDVEYHTTNGVEVAEFWASSSELRDVESTKETLWMSVGDTVCVYGRSSNIRGCDHDLLAKNVTVTFEDGVTVRKLVKMSGDSSIGGDSGGGWSWSTKAWGVHSGSNDVNSFFTTVGRAKTELNINILRK